MNAAVMESHSVEHDEGYDEFLAGIQQRFAEATFNNNPLFTTTAENSLWETYLNSFEDGPERQYRNCSTCKAFFRKYGSLVTINDDGSFTSALWDEKDAPPQYALAVKNILRLIKKSKITGVFLSEEKEWGQHEAGGWNHFAVTPRAASLYRRGLLTANQAMAEKKEDFKTVTRAILEFNENTVSQAVALLKSESLYRSEKVLGQAEFLQNIHTARASAKGERRANVVWKAVAQAPSGFCHPRSSMIGTLLEDIASGADFGEVSRKFSAKMSPLLYQRPTEAPSQVNIAQAEKLVEQMGIAASLRRRFARLDELELLWKPVVEESNATGVFAHLTPKDIKTHELNVPTVNITWDKFKRTVLPDALAIEFYATGRRDNFSAIVTAADPDAPNILQWNNTFSWYVYNGGSPASSWGLSTGWVDVTGLCHSPVMWGDNNLPHQGEAAFFILKGARDSVNKSLSLFPEILKSELRSIRSTIEAYSAKGKLEGFEEASACGFRIQKGATINGLFRVKTKVGLFQYRIDRWD